MNRKELESYRDYLKINSFSDVDNTFLDKTLWFYYDETNNSGNFHVRSAEAGFNVEPLKDFVLGGVCSEKEFNKTLGHFRDRLQIQNTALEIKSKHIVGDDFIASLGRKKVKDFLSILNENALIPHVAILNKFYFGIADIVALCGFDWSNPTSANVLMGVIDELYSMAKKDITSFSAILNRYCYPNIEVLNIQSFYSEILNFCIERHKQAKQSLIRVFKDGDLEQRYFEILVYVLNNAASGIGTPRVYGDKMVDDFNVMYHRNIPLFVNSHHIFDCLKTRCKEQQIRQFFTADCKLDCSFVDSKSSFAIQCCDVIVKIVAQASEYANRHSFEEIREAICNLGENESECLASVRLLFGKSINRHPSLFNTISPLSESSKICFLLFGEQETK